MKLATGNVSYHHGGESDGWHGVCGTGRGTQLGSSGKPGKVFENTSENGNTEVKYVHCTQNDEGTRNKRKVRTPFK